MPFNITNHNCNTIVSNEYNGWVRKNNKRRRGQPPYHRPQPPQPVDLTVQRKDIDSPNDNNSQNTDNFKPSETRQYDNCDNINKKADEEINNFGRSKASQDNEVINLDEISPSSSPKSIIVHAEHPNSTPAIDPRASAAPIPRFSPRKHLNPGVSSKIYEGLSEQDKDKVHKLKNYKIPKKSAVQ